MKSLDQVTVVLLCPLDNIPDRSMEPLREALSRVKQIGHEKVKECPELEEIILERSTSQE